jgi:hypothetical protein
MSKERGNKQSSRFGEPTPETGSNIFLLDNYRPLQPAEYSDESLERLSGVIMETPEAETCDAPHLTCHEGGQDPYEDGLGPEDRDGSFLRRMGEAGSWLIRGPEDTVA